MNQAQMIKNKKTKFLQRGATKLKKEASYFKSKKRPNSMKCNKIRCLTLNLQRKK